MRSSAAIFLLIAILPGGLPGQQWRSYTDLNPVRSLAADGNVLWAGTEGGLLSFSTVGTSVTGVFTNVDGLPSTYVTAAALGSRGRLWIGTSSSGAAVLDSSRTRFSLVNSRDQNIISDSINAVLCRGDYVFLGSPGGLSFFDGLAWQTYTDRQFPMGPSVLSLAWRGDSLLIGTDRGLTAAPLTGLTARNPALWHRYTNIGLGDSSVLSLCAGDTAVLAGTGRGIAKLTGASWTELANLGRQVRALLPLRDTLYLATSGGAWRWAGGTAGQISAGLPSPDVRTLSLDSDSNLWTGTADGLARWNGAAWSPFRQDCIPSNNVIRVAAGSDGSVWLAHGGEFASRLKPDGSVKVFPHPVPNIPVASLAVDHRDNAWLGLSYWTTPDLRSYAVKISPADSVSVITTPPLPQGLGIYDICVDKSGYVYLAGHGNVSTNYIVEISPLDSVRLYNDPAHGYLKPTSVYKDDFGNLWMGTYDLSFIRYDITQNLWQYFGLETGLSTIQFWDIVIEPSGLMWLASHNGLNRCRFDPTVRALTDVTVYKTDNCPILGNNVRAVAIDRSGNRWIATDGGLSMLSWDGKWTGYTAGDAFANGSRLLSDDVRSVSVRPRDASGDDILMATSRGLSVYGHSAAGAGAEATAFVAPNPFRPGRDHVILLSSLPDRASVSLHTLDGRLLASWAGPAAPAHTLAVDPASIPGGLPSGLYLFLVRPSSGKPQVLKLAVVR